MVLTGSCPCPEPWFRAYGAHLHLQAREDPVPTVVAVPSTVSTHAGRMNSKIAMRKQARVRRGELAAARPDLALSLARHADALLLAPHAIVAGYMALPGEADPSLLLAELAARGHEICYPRVHEKAHPLHFHVRIDGEEMALGAYNIPEPKPHWPRATPDVLLVPLLAFDAKGNRLGYGGGYYDRTLAQLRREKSVTAIGVAFSGQEVDAVPSDASDQRLEFLVSERGIRQFG